ncbi:diguanylate cyclase domain-containing protein [Cellulosilyticum sp. I15G10I2]|uniref:diguanylate cyclase domain-containing protein n=1 Tax=Cellulosilyticum sp. I15G10I2 TaxID=1892843 RepID=UPI00085CB8B7|nr:diguanylate cyclase [Cellulosilyticum sp. I15G10I2]
MDGPCTIEIETGIYWVGNYDQNGGLHGNPYLIVDGEEGVLIDPGSVLNFEAIYTNILSIIPLEKIKYLILHHQDPDFCSSVPLFEQKGAHFTLVTHWKTQALVKYYGIKSDYYIVNENDFKLTLKSGRELKFIQTPYLHFSGAITTYDTSSKILFSSDLFGCLAYRWDLFAKADYIEKMKTFHEHFMPSHDILGPVMESFLRMDISIIAPQHGSIITSDIKKHIRALRDLECGLFLMPIKKELLKSGGYMHVFTSVLKRYAAIFSHREVIETIKGLDVTIDEETLEVVDYNYTGERLWHLLFEQILAKRGIEWLIVIEPLIQKLTKEFDLTLPFVFSTITKQAEEKVYLLQQENLELKKINSSLSRCVKETRESLIKCPITGLYNYEFFKMYLKTAISNIENEGDRLNPGLIVLNLDNMAKIRFVYGDQEVNQTLKNTVYIINQLKNENILIFRLQGAAFACYLPHTTKEESLIFAEKIRTEIADSEKYIENITVSIGIAFYEEIISSDHLADHTSEALYELCMLRVKLARNGGKNSVCIYSDISDYEESEGKILIADTDDVNLDLLKTLLENLRYEVIIVSDGETVLKVAESELPNVIITELMLPQKDAFLVRQELLINTKTQDIPFIIVSHLKNEITLERAIALDIAHYFKKPFMLSELLGVIKLSIKRRAGR